MVKSFDWFQTVISLSGYNISMIEIISVLAGIIAVFYAAKENIITWPIGLVNICTAFFIYYHIRLYSDMFLQVYFFSISIYGWFSWKIEKKEKIPLKYLSLKQLLFLCFSIIVLTIMIGMWMTQIHMIFPMVFPQPAAYPYADTFVAISSIIANTLLARRFIENWILWILVDIICIYLYIQKEIVFIAFEFLIFLFLAIYGWREWYKLKKKQELIESNQ